MTFIEKNLPIEQLNLVAMAEGNAKKPVYQMHKWWARRLGSVFRMITLSVFGQEEESEVSIWHKFCNGSDLQGKISKYTTAVEELTEAQCVKKL